jgi:CheY-like chemotaxis protein
MRLEQIVSNLLTNAIKFTPPGGSVRLVLEGRERVTLRVVDSGRGITPDLLPFIFDRFRQGEGSMTRRYGGLGLGLAIVKHLVKLHGGEIRAESAGEGQGATFILELNRSAPDAPGRKAATALLEGDATRQLHAVRVLVVEDDDDWRDMLAQWLTGAGAGVKLVDSAAAAVRVLDEELPDVLISDVGMPGEDGFSLIARIRARSPQAGGRVPAIALTAYTRDEDRSRALSAGFDAHFSKPFESAELLAAIRRLARAKS